MSVDLMQQQDNPAARRSGARATEADRQRRLFAAIAAVVGQDEAECLFAVAEDVPFPGEELEVELMPDDTTRHVDWADCPAVSIDPERMSAAVCFKGTRLPVGHLFENLLHGATVSEFIEWYGADPEQVRAVLQWIIDGLETAPDTSLDRRYAGPPQETEQ